jgi:hypothetical protein
MKLKNRKPKDNTPLKLLAGALLFFGLFVFLITRPSKQSEAMKELDLCYNSSEVRKIWDKYKTELHQDEEFLFQLRSRLSTFNLGDSEIEKCRQWLPPAPESINVIVIPDLSRRITDTYNNPNQVQNDIFILQNIWSSFADYSKLKQDSKDKLIVDLTDIDQAQGQFGKVANNLQFDLSGHKGKSNRLFFTDEKQKQFSKSVIEMYKLGREKPLGADYRFYLRRYLKSHIKKSTLFDTYRNKVIFITDGYLEAEISGIDTKIDDPKIKSMLYKSVQNGNVLDIISSNKLNIPIVNIDLTNTDVMVCEVNERKTGKGHDYEILKTYWEDWFQRMRVKSIEVLQREQATASTAIKVKEFIIK